MSTAQVPQKPQSGVKIALGILGFILGLTFFLWALSLVVH